MTIDELNRYFQELEQSETFSGVISISKRKKAVYTAAYGYANRPWRIKNDLETRFDTASVTKLFTAVAILQLVDRGLFQLDTSVTRFLALEQSAISPDVTVYHLLTHSSGIGDDCEEEDGEVYEELFKTKPNYSIVETADFLPQFIDKPANFPPGQGCRYCNCSYVLLGLMIEKGTGMTYRDYVRRHIFDKVGMTRSGFFRMDRVYDNVAEGYDPLVADDGLITGWKKNIYSYPPVGSPDGGAYVTAHDLERFIWAVQAGKLLSAELTQAFFTPQVDYEQHDDWVMRYGFGLWFYVDQAGKIICYQKEGINAGVSAVLRYFPEQEVTVSILSNMENGVWEPIWKVHEMVVAGEFS